MNIKVNTLTPLPFLLGHLCLSGLWLGVPPSTDSKKTWVNKEIALHAQNIITIVGSRVNIIGGTYMTI